MEWAAAAGNPLCPADADILGTYLGEIPGCYERLAERSLDPLRTGRAIRRPPGSRVLVGPEFDALMRETAAWIGGWAARVRTVPGLQLARHEHAHGSQEQVAADCLTLAGHVTQLLALPPGPMARTWTFAAGRSAPEAQRPFNAMPLLAPAPPAPRPVPCRRCAHPLTPSPSGRHWWPAACTHARASAVTDADVLVIGYSCQVCGTRLPASWTPNRCEHAPGAGVTAPAPGMPSDLEDEIADLEVVRSGDGWVTAWTDLGGDAAALDIFDLRQNALKLLMETPAPRDGLDGVPCRKCDASAPLEVLPSDPPDPELPAPAFCRCSACRDEMTRKEYDDWVRQYDAWARADGVKTCKRCERGRCGECSWPACSCKATGHRNASAA